MAEKTICDKCGAGIKTHAEAKFSVWVDLAGRIRREHNMKDVNLDICSSCVSEFEQLLTDWQNGTKLTAPTVTKEVKLQISEVRRGGLLAVTGRDEKKAKKKGIRAWLGK